MIATTAGTSILSLQAWVQSNLGGQGWESVLLQLPAEHAQELRGILVSSKRYPTAAFVAAVDAAAELDGRPDSHERYGEWAAGYMINAFFKFLLRFKSPAWALGRGMRIWRSFHSTGEWKLEVDESARRLRGELSDFAIVNPNYCRLLVGWIRGAGRLTGAPRLRVAHPYCRARGAPACVFTGEW
jgi:hypothetical protein